MILWLTGNTGSGKSTLARWIARNSRNTVILDGDAMREVWNDLGLSEEHRRENCLRIARLARSVAHQGISVVVAAICPYRDLRDEVRAICGCSFIHVPHPSDGRLDPVRPYEVPENREIIARAVRENA